jgi:hypothetical protein
MKIKTVDMSVTDFIKIPANPIQRDTKLHANTAVNFHLASKAVTHAKVSIAKCKTAKWKLDGHTRAYLWKEGELQSPATLSVDIYTVKDKAEAIELYKHFDNAKAAESIPDKVSGALKFMKIINYNKFAVRGAGIVNGLHALNSALEIYVPRQDVLRLMIPWSKELKIFINQHWVSNSSHGKPGVPAAVTLAFLVTMRMYGTDSLGFWDSYYNNSPSKTLMSGRSGCQAAIDWILKARSDGLITGRQNTVRNAQALITAYHYYRSKKPVERLTKLYSRDNNNSFISQFGIYLKDIGFPTT